jgi:hypothetical protein
MATKKPMKKFKRYDEGGSVEEAMAKQRGLDISNKEAPVGFFERIRAGNIDQPGSEAYNRFGAGRGRDRGESVSVNQPMPSAPSMPAASSRPLSDDMYSDFGPSAGRSSSETITPTRPAATKPVVPAKPAATPVPPLRNTGPDRSSLINKPPAYAGPLRGMRSDAGTSPPIATHGGPRDEEKLLKPAKPSMDTKTMNENAKKAMADDPSSLMGMAGAGAAALFGASKLGKLFKGAKKAAGAGRDLVVSSPKGSAMGKADDAKAAKAYDKLKKSKFTKGDDVTDVTAKKRGGAVKKYASGGMVSSASRRADGIATKGKTRCKIC